MADGIDYTHFADIKKSLTQTLHRRKPGDHHIQNTEKGPLATQSARGLQYAVNEDRIQDRFYGYGEIARQCVPPNWLATIPSRPMSSTRKKRRSFWPRPVTPMASKFHSGLYGPAALLPGPHGLCDPGQIGPRKNRDQGGHQDDAVERYRAERVKGNFDLCLAGYLRNPRYGCPRVCHVPQLPGARKYRPSAMPPWTSSRRGSPIYGANVPRSISNWLTRSIGYPMADIVLLRPLRPEARSRISLYGSTWVPLQFPD